ncbi:DNA cytosine methyltransferase [uncultured Porphyromonas sp.]|uniref:DNA cytosine methyltransferase n=1 Tax=uncultured Porphyromonas sp. TaxID=159274 RepID=UPI0027DDB6B2|nr:DNA cytosine methyltransferase [uncultured Porphyromonas sp.]
MTHGSLFSGIGGFDLAAEQVGWTNLFHCEWNPFCRRVLDYHFPNSESYEDIKETDFRKWQGKVDVLSGGFPCQPFSTAGLRKGSTDDRYLWPEMLRAIDEVRPTWIVGENVAGLLSMVHPSEKTKMESSQNLFGESYEVYEQRDQYILFEIIEALESRGYSVQSFIIPAVSVGAPHRRDRIWIVAYSNDTRVESTRREGQNEANVSNVVTNSNSSICKGECNGQQKEGESNRCNSDYLQARKAPRGWSNFPSQSPVCGGDDGIPRELDSITFPRWRTESVKAYGNAIVLEVARRIFECIDQLS